MKDIAPTEISSFGLDFDWDNILNGDDNEEGEITVTPDVQQNNINNSPPRSPKIEYQNLSQTLATDSSEKVTFTQDEINTEQDDNDNRLLLHSINDKIQTFTDNKKAEIEVVCKELRGVNRKQRSVHRNTPPIYNESVINRDLSGGTKKKHSKVKLTQTDVLSTNDNDKSLCMLETKTQNSFKTNNINESSSSGIPRIKGSSKVSRDARPSEFDDGRYTRKRKKSKLSPKFKFRSSGDPYSRSRSNRPDNYATRNRSNTHVSFYERRAFDQRHTEKYDWNEHFSYKEYSDYLYPNENLSYNEYSEYLYSNPSQNPNHFYKHGRLSYGPPVNQFGQNTSDDCSMQTAPIVQVTNVIGKPDLDWQKLTLPMKNDHSPMSGKDFHEKSTNKEQRCGCEWMSEIKWRKSNRRCTYCPKKDKSVLKHQQDQLSSQRVYPNIAGFRDDFERNTPGTETIRKPCDWEMYGHMSDTSDTIKHDPLPSDFPRYDAVDMFNVQRKHVCMPSVDNLPLMCIPSASGMSGTFHMCGVTAFGMPSTCTTKSAPSISQLHIPQISVSLGSAILELSPPHNPQLSDTIIMSLGLPENEGPQRSKKRPNKTKSKRRKKKTRKAQVGYEDETLVDVTAIDGEDTGQFISVDSDMLDGLNEPTFESHIESNQKVHTNMEIKLENPNHNALPAALDQPTYSESHIKSTQNEYINVDMKLEQLSDNKIPATLNQPTYSESRIELDQNEQANVDIKLELHSDNTFPDNENIATGTGYVKDFARPEKSANIDEQILQANTNNELKPSFRFDIVPKYIELGKQHKAKRKSPVGIALPVQNVQVGRVKYKLKRIALPEKKESVYHTLPRIVMSHISANDPRTQKCQVIIENILTANQNNAIDNPRSRYPAMKRVNEYPRKASFPRTEADRCLTQHSRSSFELRRLLKNTNTVDIPNNSIIAGSKASVTNLIGQFCYIEPMLSPVNSDVDISGLSGSRKIENLKRNYTNNFLNNSLFSLPFDSNNSNHNNAGGQLELCNNSENLCDMKTCKEEKNLIHCFIVSVLLRLIKIEHIIPLFHVQFDYNNNSPYGSDDTRQRPRKKDKPSRRKINSTTEPIEENASDASEMTFELDQMSTPVLLNPADRVYHIKKEPDIENNGNWDMNQKVNSTHCPNKWCHTETVPKVENRTTQPSGSHQRQVNQEDEDLLSQALINAGISNTMLDRYLDLHGDIESTFNEHELFSLERDLGTTQSGLHLPSTSSFRPAGFSGCVESTTDRTGELQTPDVKLEVVDTHTVASDRTFTELKPFTPFDTTLSVSNDEPYNNSTLQSFPYSKPAVDNVKTHQDSDTTNFEGWSGFDWGSLDFINSVELESSTLHPVKEQRDETEKRYNLRSQNNSPRKLSPTPLNTTESCKDEIQSGNTHCAEIVDTEGRSSDKTRGIIGTFFGRASNENGNFKNSIGRNKRKQKQKHTNSEPSDVEESSEASPSVKGTKKKGRKKKSTLTKRPKKKKHLNPVECESEPDCECPLGASTSTRPQTRRKPYSKRKTKIKDKEFAHYDNRVGAPSTSNELPPEGRVLRPRQRDAAVGQDEIIYDESKWAENNFKQQCEDFQNAAIFASTLFKTVPHLKAKQTTDLILNPPPRPHKYRLIQRAPRRHVFTIIRDPFNSTRWLRRESTCTNNNADNGDSFASTSNSQNGPPNTADQKILKRQLRQKDKELQRYYSLNQKRPERSSFVSSMISTNSMKTTSRVSNNFTLFNEDSKPVEKKAERIVIPSMDGTDPIPTHDMPAVKPCVIKFVHRMMSGYGDYFTDPGLANREKRLVACQQYLLRHGITSDGSSASSSLSDDLDTFPTASTHPRDYNLSDELQLDTRSLDTQCTNTSSTGLRHLTAEQFACLEGSSNNLTNQSRLPPIPDQNIKHKKVTRFSLPLVAQGSASKHSTDNTIVPNESKTDISDATQGVIHSSILSPVGHEATVLPPISTKNTTELFESHYQDIPSTSEQYTLSCMSTEISISLNQSDSNTTVNEVKDSFGNIEKDNDHTDSEETGLLCSKGINDVLCEYKNVLLTEGETPSTITNSVELDSQRDGSVDLKSEVFELCTEAEQQADTVTAVDCSESITRDIDESKERMGNMEESATDCVVENNLAEKDMPDHGDGVQVNTEQQNLDKVQKDFDVDISMTNSDETNVDLFQDSRHYGDGDAYQSEISSPEISSHDTALDKITNDEEMELCATFASSMMLNQEELCGGEVRIGNFGFADASMFIRPTSILMHLQRVLSPIPEVDEEHFEDEKAGVTGDINMDMEGNDIDKGEAGCENDIDAAYTNDYAYYDEDNTVDRHVDTNDEGCKNVSKRDEEMEQKESSCENDVDAAYTNDYEYLDEDNTVDRHVDTNDEECKNVSKRDEEMEQKESSCENKPNVFPDSKAIQDIAATMNEKVLAADDIQHQQ